MVEEINVFTSWAAGTGHEIEGALIKKQPWGETMMDLHNNDVGRMAGKSGQTINPNDLVTLDSAPKYNPYGSYGGGK